MGIQLSSENEARVRALVENGTFASADDVVESALLLLEQEQEFAEVELEEAIRVGEQALREGRWRVVDESLREEVFRRAGLKLRR
ncbi:MAG: type II toxin-antitoxin system ParD family antitoxin [Dehalococcoidia bacterium]|jgi:Arc/MetJ-type ribon-helix-helix transcriptional regulator